MENMLKYDLMKYRHRLLYYRVASIYIRKTLYTTKKEKNFQIWSLYHSRDRIVAASRPLQIYTECANPIGAVLSCFIFYFFCFVLFFFVVFCFDFFSNIMCFVFNFGKVITMRLYLYYYYFFFFLHIIRIVSVQ
jgi:hypothetical protein